MLGTPADAHPCTREADDLTSQEEEEAEVERQMEWGGGVKQAKDKAKALEDMRRERAKPFARSRNDPELDSMMRDRVRFGDPMAHLVGHKCLRTGAMSARMSLTRPMYVWQVKRKEAVIQEDEEDEDEQYNLLGFKVPKAVPAHRQEEAADACLNPNPSP